jgi:hypothetical protein
VGSLHEDRDLDRPFLIGVDHPELPKHRHIVRQSKYLELFSGRQPRRQPVNEVPLWVAEPSKDLWGTSPHSASPGQRCIGGNLSRVVRQRQLHRFTIMGQEPPPQDHLGVIGETQSRAYLSRWPHLSHLEQLVGIPGTWRKVGRDIDNERLLVPHVDTLADLTVDESLALES